MGRLKPTFPLVTALRARLEKKLMLNGAIAHGVLWTRSGGGIIHIHPDYKLKPFIKASIKKFEYSLGLRL